MLKLKRFKSENQVISRDLLSFLKQNNDLHTLIETGTYLGETTSAAADIYDVVHSIELSEKLYSDAKDKFSDISNIHLYLGDSAEVLPEILQFENKNVLFWLDGHYSEGNTAKGKKSTPIIEELEAIAKANATNFVILIDDMRIFQKPLPNNPESLKGYPTVAELQEKSRKLFPDSLFKIIGDIALLTNKLDMQFSDVINALTTSRIASCADAPSLGVLRAERIIANAESEEKETLLNLCTDYGSTEKYGLGAHYRLWRSLILANERSTGTALEELYYAVKLGMKHVRITPYENAILNDDYDFFSDKIKMQSLKTNDLYFNEDDPVASPDDLLEKMLQDNIFYDVKKLVFAGVHKFQEKNLIERLFPNLKKALLLEPIPEIAAELQRNLYYDQKYRVIEAALSDKTGTSSFNLTDNEAMSSSLLELGRHKTLFPYVHDAGKIQIKTVTLDKLLQNNGIEKSDALILDIQGAEYMVLASIQPEIAAQFDFIYSEVSLSEIYKNAGTLDDIKSLLADDFVFAAYAPNTNDVKEHGNALFINKRVAQKHYPYLNETSSNNNGILIATSISPNNIARQQTAVNSWIELGFDVVSINSYEEIETIKNEFPTVQFVETSFTAADITGKPLIYFDTIRNYLEKNGGDVCGIVNSDIELKPDFDLIPFLQKNIEQSLIFGARQDISAESSESEKYPWGFDYFFFDREILDVFVKSEFCLGMPWWDYWVPLFLIKAGIDVKYLESEIAFHSKHETNYKHEYWIKFAKYFAKHLYPEFHKEFLKVNQIDFFGESANNDEKINAIAQSLSSKAINSIHKSSKKISNSQHKKMKTTNLKISVITPSFNSEKYIKDTVNSVKQQSYPAYEHIIIDGASTDNTLNILKSQQNIKLISEPDNGQSHAINKGFQIAKGDIIAWINSDDYYYDENVFDKVIEAFEKNKDAKIIIGDCLFTYEGIKPDLPVKNRPYDFDHTLRYWRNFVPPTQPSIFFKKELLDEFGLLDETLNYAMDYDLWLRITQKYPIHYVAYPFSVYRFTDDSKSGTGDDWSHFYPEWHKVYLRYKEKNIKMPLQPIITAAFPVLNNNDFINELNKRISEIQSQIMQDMEILLITDFDCEKLIKEDKNQIIPIHLIKIDKLDKKSFKNAVVQYSKGAGVHCPALNIPVHQALYAKTADQIIDKNVWDNIKFKNSENSYHPLLDSHSDLGPEIIKNVSTMLLDEIVPAIGDKYFSVIIPTYNRSAILIQCLEALNQQNFDNEDFEVIVIDDGSTDNTESLMRNYSPDYRFRYIQQKNAGPGAARNTGIKNATGKYLLILNDDTIAAPDLLSKHQEYHKKYQGKKTAILGSFEYVKEAKVKPFTFFLSKSPMVFAYPAMKAGAVYNYRYFWTCNVSILRDAIVSAGGFDPDFSDPMIEDTELGYRLEKLGYKVIYAPDAISEHYHSMDIHGFIKRQQMSGRNIVKLFEKHPELLKKERRLFGFDDLSDATLEKFRNFIDENSEKAEENIKFFDQIEQYDIYNPNFISIGNDSTVKSDELIKAMNGNIWLVHFVNFYKGILDAIAGKPEAIAGKPEDTNLKSSDEVEPTTVETVQHSPSNARDRILQLACAIKKQAQTEHQIVQTKAEPEIIPPTKKRILLSMFGWSESGGGTTFPRSVANEFANKGYEVGVVYAALEHPSNNQPYFMEERIEDGVKLFPIYNRTRDFLMADLPELEIYDKNAVEIWEKVVEEFQPDIIHYHNFLGLSFGICDIAFRKKIPTLYSPHNYHLIDPELYMINSDLSNWKNSDLFTQSKLYQNNKEKAAGYDQRAKKALELINSKIDKTLAISHRVKELLIDFGGNPDKIEVLYQAPKAVSNIEPVHYKASDANIRVGFIGNMMPNKGLHILAGASRRINRNCDIILYGSGNRKYITELLKISQNRLTFKGAYTEKDFPEIAQNVDLIVMPSIWEECAGLVIQEAFAMGKPVIGARIGGIPEFIDENVNGYTYPYNSPINLAALINSLIVDKSRLEILSENAKAITTYEKYIGTLKGIYEAMIAKHQH